MEEVTVAFSEEGQTSERQLAREAKEEDDGAHNMSGKEEALFFLFFCMDALKRLLSGTPLQREF